MKILVPLAKSKTQFYINQAYIKYLIENDFKPVLIVKPTDIEKYADFCDGLLLPGGTDIDPIYYGIDNIYSYKTDPERDSFERELFTKFLYLQKPVFGICRGFQLIFKELKYNFKDIMNSMKFIQNIDHHEINSINELSRGTCSHYITLTNSESTVFKEQGGKLSVNSMHHQAVITNTNVYRNDLIKIEAISDLGIKPGKQIIESFSCETYKLFGVQWHPEEILNDKLIGIFFNGNRS